jgi:hypothetical protein
MNSFGAYWASLATVSVPFDLIAAGTCAAIAEFALGVETLAPVDVADVLLLELLLPQPASTTTTSAGTPRRATSVFIETSWN